MNKDLTPFIATHPGEIIRDELKERGMTQKQLSEQTGIKTSVLSETINGKRSVSMNVAIALEKALGIPAEIWMNLQNQYDLDKTKNILDNLSQYKSETPSKWKDAAEERRANKKWLRYSQNIAMMMLDKMDELRLTQKRLAEIMGCSQQYVSKILQGKENLTLETMEKIEDVLHLDLFSETVKKVNKPAHFV